MIEDTIGKIEAQIRNAENIKEDRRQELLELLGTLKAEVAKLPASHSTQAQNIARYTELSAHEATRRDLHPDQLKVSLKGLSSSVQGFEGSHPRLVEIVSALSQALSNLGI